MRMTSELLSGLTNQATKQAYDLHSRLLQRAILQDLALAVGLPTVRKL